MRHLWVAGLLAGSLASAACRDQAEIAGPTGPGGPQVRMAAVPPADLVTVPAGSTDARIWAYVTNDLVTAQDPVNLIFTGMADPRAIRNALLGLDGSRAPAFPPVFPFTCTWSDAIGGLMAGYDEATGWAGGAVQLQCGSYGPIRFHLRLFKLGGFTIGNAHFEVVIPGTTDHQVLSWELAEQLLRFDLARTGLLGAAPATTAAINAAPSYRAIPAVIYNGLPASLRGLIGGPLSDVTSEVGILTDGHAASFVLAGEAPPAAAASTQSFVIQFDQLIPKPFCSTGPGDFVLVKGPVRLDQEVRTLAGELRQVFHADGELEAIPIDIATLQPSGPPFSAKVSEWQDSRAGVEGGSVQGTQLQQLLPASRAGAGRLQIRLNVAAGRAPKYDLDVVCH